MKPKHGRKFLPLLVAVLPLLTVAVDNARGFLFGIEVFPPSYTPTLPTGLLSNDLWFTGNSAREFVAGQSEPIRVKVNGLMVGFRAVMVNIHHAETDTLWASFSFYRQPDMLGRYEIDPQLLDHMTPGTYVITAALVDRSGQGLGVLDTETHQVTVLQTAAAQPAPPSQAPAPVDEGNEADQTPSASAASSVAIVVPSSIHTRGAGGDVTIKTDGDLGPGQDLLVLAWSDTESRMLDEWAFEVHNRPYRIAAGKLDTLPAGSVELQVMLREGRNVLDMARRTITVNETAAAESGPKRHVNGVDLQSGKTYSNLVIHGGIRAIWTRIDNVTFIDCDFVDAQTHVTVQLRRDSSDSADNWRFIRCSFTGATRDDWGHAHGVFLEHVGTFTFEDCVFQDNGWLYGPGNSKGRFNQNHHVYLVNVGNVTFDRCSFNRASAQGIKARGFRKLVVRDSTFRDNLIDISTDDRNDCGTVEIIGTRFQNTGGIDSSGTEMGWSCNFEHYNHSVDRVTIRDCTWTGPGASKNTRAVKFAGGGVRDASITNVDLRNWRGDRIINQIGARLKLADILGGIFN